MKKIISMMLVTALMLGTLCVGAFATSDEITDLTTPVTKTQDVYAKYAEGAKVDTYKVVLTWGSMNFNYSAKSERWDTDEHKWIQTNAAAWTAAEEGAGNITIVNHSSKAVTAAFSFNATAEGVGGNFSEQTVTVKSAAENFQAEEQTVTFTPTGDLAKTEENTADYVKIGTITVTLN